MAFASLLPSIRLILVYEDSIVSFCCVVAILRVDDRFEFIDFPRFLFDSEFEEILAKVIVKNCFDLSLKGSGNFGFGVFVAVKAQKLGEERASFSRFEVIPIPHEA